MTWNVDCFLCNGLNGLSRIFISLARFDCGTGWEWSQSGSFDGLLIGSWSLGPCSCGFASIRGWFFGSVLVAWCVTWIMKGENSRVAMCWWKLFGTFRIRFSRHTCLPHLSRAFTLFQALPVSFAYLSLTHSSDNFNSFSNLVHPSFWHFPRATHPRPKTQLYLSCPPTFSWRPTCSWST